jgi:hypothetical protein
MPPGQPPWPNHSKSEPPQQPSRPSAKRRWPRRHPIWSILIAVFGLLIIVGAITNPKPTKVSNTVADAAASAPAADKSPLKCQAQAMSERPRDHTTVAIRVHTEAHAKVTVTSHLALLKNENATGSASDNGTRTIRFHVGDAKPGTRVFVSVRSSYHGRAGSCRASFSPRAAVALVPRATQPAAAPSSAPATSPTTQPVPAKSPAPAPPATTASCYPLSNEGTCYEPGEYCRDDDHGTSGVAGDGKTIICEDNDGWRWEPA